MTSSPLAFFIYTRLFADLIEMKKTLILCFVHGFKGGESTFGKDYKFAFDLRDQVARKLPKINIKVLIYPRYETRGDLGEAVAKFRDWLQDKVIDLEVATGTPSPTVDPSIRTILVGHSMGGIVAAETVMAITSDRPIPAGDGGLAADPVIAKMGTSNKGYSQLNGMMFPYIQGVLAFDTPFLGIAPGMVAHSAEGHYQAATQAVIQFGGLAGLWGSSNSPKQSQKPAGALPAPEAPSSGSSATVEKDKSGGGWGTFGKIAAFAGAGAALAGAGAAAYLGRDHIVAGAGWVGSHLEFVGTLARAEELRSRVNYMARVSRELDIGFANLYTRLGKGTHGSIFTADGSPLSSLAGQVVGPSDRRTFCNLPSGKEPSGTWMEALNDKAGDEAAAHMTMFEPGDNPGYRKLAIDATNLIVSWAKNQWYESSS